MPFGRLKCWDSASGWGYIAPGDRAKTGGDVFLHVSELKKIGLRDAKIGDAFAYAIVVHGCATTTIADLTPHSAENHP
jgi:cold shock CspA family protein